MNNPKNKCYKESDSKKFILKAPMNLIDSSG